MPGSGASRWCLDGPHKSIPVIYLRAIWTPLSLDEGAHGAGGGLGGRDEVERLNATGDEGGVYFGVESGKAPAVFHRQGEEVDFGEVGGRGKHGEEAFISEG